MVNNPPEWNGYKVIVQMPTPIYGRKKFFKKSRKKKNTRWAVGIVSYVYLLAKSDILKMENTRTLVIRNDDWIELQKQIDSTHGQYQQHNHLMQPPMLLGCVPDPRVLGLRTCI